MATTDGLVVWLRSQLDEDEQIARAAHGYHWLDDGEWVIDEDEHILDGQPANTRHAARHDPAFVIAEIRAKRRLLAEAKRAQLFCKAGDSDSMIRRAQTDYVLRLLASAYADRDGYRDEWRP